MRAYLSGPMSGLPNFNHKTFNRATMLLRTSGMWDEIFNPAEQDRELFPPDEYAGEWETENGEASLRVKRIAMRHDLQWICNHAEAIILLPEWEHSAGAQTELSLAHHYLGLPAFLYRGHGGVISVNVDYGVPMILSAPVNISHV